MFANLHHNLCEYGSLRGTRHSDGGPRILTGHGINTFCSMHGTKCVDNVRRNPSTMLRDRVTCNPPSGCKKS
ncbi:hypothetical protein TNCV_4990311 [Trichonephila clavipes]|uniref:Uncharacterized protein n=1 Tax=Trichonephila clavipes TaxID=2585209 RepID=A0A8X7BIC9_TRICX|nr:hypothetical protein TNCV_4990311 [Trichonephila clavipes]